MKFEVFECSPKAKAKIKSYADPFEVKENLPKSANEKYPWVDLKIGQSFIVGLDTINESNLRNLAACKNQRTGKIFRVIKHSELKIFEVARIA